MLPQSPKNAVELERRGDVSRIAEVPAGPAKDGVTGLRGHRDGGDDGGPGAGANFLATAGNLIAVSSDTSRSGVVPASRVVIARAHHPWHDPQRTR